MDEDGEIIGEGTHSIVRVCQCKKTGKEYAVKIFRSEDEQMFLHAEREFQILQTLNGHPNIVGGIDYIPEFLRSRGYLVIEKIEGESILNMVIDKGPFQEKEAAQIMKQILESIDFIHSKKIIHRDMNPTNVFLVQGNLVKILDFNVSKILTQDNQNETNEQGVKYKFSLFTKTGTPIYTAPEMHTSFRYSESIDMWGVGTVLYTMLLGEPPFTEPNIPKLTQLVVNAEYDRTSKDWQSLSEDAKNIIQGLLCVDPIERLSPQEALNHPWIKQASATSFSETQNKELNI